MSCSLRGAQRRCRHCSNTGRKRCNLQRALGSLQRRSFFKGQTYANLEFWAFFIPAAFSRTPSQRTKPCCARERRCIHSWQNLLYVRKIPSGISGSHLCSPLPGEANQGSQFQPSITKLWLPEDSVAQLHSGSYSEPNISFSAGVREVRVTQSQVLQIECDLRNANAWTKRLLTYRKGRSAEQLIHFPKFISSMTWRKSSGFSEFHLPLEPQRKDGSESLGWKALWEQPCQPPSMDISVRWHPFCHRTSFYSPWISSITTAFRIHFFKTKMCLNINAIEK